MTTNLPAPGNQSRAVVASEGPPQLPDTVARRPGGQNIAAGLVPFAIVTFGVIVFVVAVWTLLAAAGAQG